MTFQTRRKLVKARTGILLPIESMGTPDNFQFSAKVPETDKLLDVNKGAMTHLEEFLDKISPLETSNKLGTGLV
jgi:hypothetical protein